jgi:hypothetical protein
VHITHSSRPIRAGEECCISYLNPPLQSRTRRKAHLERQHFFSPTLPTPAPQQPVDPSPQQHMPASAQQQQQEQPPRTQARAPPTRKATVPACALQPTFPAEMEAWLKDGVSGCWDGGLEHWQQLYCSIVGSDTLPALASSCLLLGAWAVACSCAMLQLHRELLPLALPYIDLLLDVLFLLALCLFFFHSKSRPGVEVLALK